MKLYIVLSALLAVSLAAPQAVVPPVKIIEQEQEVNGDGSYSFQYKSEDGIQRQETGGVKPIVGDDEGEGIAQSGKVTYTAPDGQVISLSFTADENGFNPVGAHLPSLTLPS